MEALQVKHLNFRYRGFTGQALRDVSLSVQEGEIVLLCGPSGCGKTTLLRHWKPVLAPKGERGGEILFFGEDIAALPEREAAARIGMLQQDVDAQLVLDTVRAELAFGLECIGTAPALLHRRVAEAVSFFGIEAFYRRQTDALSGGEKQLVSLAAVMAMQPQALLLDESSSQLDPIAAVDFHNALLRINRELGTTIVLTEQRLDEVFALADRVAVMDNGELLFTGAPGEAAAFLAGQEQENLRALLPLPAKLYLRHAKPPQAEQLPVTVRQAKTALGRNGSPQGKQPKTVEKEPGEALLELQDVDFRFAKEQEPVLRELSLTVFQAELLCVLGGNGAGKSTLLRLLNGAIRPWRGKIKYKKDPLRIAYLPQNPKLLFARETLAEDFADITATVSAGKRFLAAAGIIGERHVPVSDQLQALLDKTGLSALLQRHPYDLSAGELQRAALVKLLLTQPDLLLLDEPTKGLDADNREILAQLLQNLRKEGKTIVAVTHDVEFAAQQANRCALLFDGSFCCVQEPEAFFCDNLFYTTVENRILIKGDFV